MFHSAAPYVNNSRLPSGESEGEPMNSGEVWMVVRAPVSELKSTSRDMLRPSLKSPRKMRLLSGCHVKPFGTNGISEPIEICRTRAEGQDISTRSNVCSLVLANPRTTFE